MLIGVALFCCCGKYRTNNKKINKTKDSDIDKENMFDNKVKK